MLGLLSGDGWQDGITTCRLAAVLPGAAGSGREQRDHCYGCSGSCDFYRFQPVERDIFQRTGPELAVCEAADFATGLFVQPDPQLINCEPVTLNERDPELAYDSWIARV